VEAILFHLIELDTLLAPSNEEKDAAKKATMREQLAKGQLRIWFGALEVRRAACACALACMQR
jgi:hypothetical protein